MQRKIIQKINNINYTYDIIISKSIIHKFISEFALHSTYYVIDKNIYDIYKDIFPNDNIFIFDPSEKDKSINSVIKIEQFLYDKKALRDSLLISIGGGITGDIVGFAASIYMRGIAFIQIPTTLLAMVDSSIGGKTGINFCDVKNNIGSFYQPKKVIIDIDFLSSLSKIEFLNGLAEVIKIASISGGTFLQDIIDNRSKILERDTDTILNMIEVACKLKSDIVAEDTLESGRRKLLNFGHTIAHAIETDSDNKITHGYAVAIGMVYEMKYGLMKDLVTTKTFEIIRNTLYEFGYHVDYSINSRDIFLVALNKDKKATSDGISLVLTDERLIGKIINNVQATELIRVFD